MMASYDPICLLCAHRRPDGVTCSAFPDQIPLVILHGKSLHLRPRRGDGGLQFTLRDGESTRDAAQGMVDTGQLPASILLR